MAGDSDQQSDEEEILEMEENDDNDEDSDNDDNDEAMEEDDNDGKDQIYVNPFFLSRGKKKYFQICIKRIWSIARYQNTECFGKFIRRSKIVRIRITVVNFIHIRLLRSSGSNALKKKNGSGSKGIQMQGQIQPVIFQTF